VRRALGQQVGRHHQPVAAGRGGARERKQILHARLGRQRVARPAQHHAAVVDRAADGPAIAGKRVTEQAPLVVDDRPLHHQPQCAARADRAGRDPRAHRADAEVRQRPVAGPRDHALADYVGGRHELGELLAPHTGQLERLVAPVQRLQVEQAGPGSDRPVDHPAAGEPMHDELLQPHPAARPGVDLRLALA
jgi:hypothetical protein